jgi:frataxin-like iron-binding protein CyaY
MKELIIETIESQLETHPMLSDAIDFTMQQTQDGNLVINCDNGEQYVVTVCRVR